MRRSFLIFCVSVLLLGCVSSAVDSESATRVKAYLDSTGVIPSDNSEADKTHSGKIVYVAPGVNGSPHFTYYEVTTQDEMQRLKGAAEEALKNEPSIRNITLHFMERQVWHQAENGAGYRGKENEINTIVVSR